MIASVGNYLAMAAAVSIVAIGFSLLYQTLKFVNFAHQTSITLAAYSCYYLHVILDYNLLLSIVASITVASVLGCAQYFFVFKYFNGKKNEYQVVVSFGIALVTEAALAIIFGTSNKSLGIADLMIGIGEKDFYLRDILLVLIILFIVPFAIYLYNRSKIGLLALAVPDNLEQVKIWGLNTLPALLAVFAFTYGLGGIAGIYLGIGYSVFPGMGLKWTIWAFSVAVVGGLGSLNGTVIASFVLTIPLYLSYRFGGAVWADAIVFFVAAVVLLVRPQGLFALRIRKV